MEKIDTGTEHLIFEKENGVAVLTMNRPEARNAMSGEMNEAMRATLEEVEILTKHAHPEVQKMAKDTLLRKEPLPHHQPRIILKDFDTSLSSSTAQVQGTLSNASIGMQKSEGRVASTSNSNKRRRNGKKQKTKKRR